MRAGSSPVRPQSAWHGCRPRAAEHPLLEPLSDDQFEVSPIIWRITMGVDQYHEPANELPEETRTFARMIASLTKDAEAINWYQQRLALEKDPQGPCDHARSAARGVQALRDGP